MELTVEQVKEWVLLFSDFTWPLVAIIVLIIYKDAVVHLLKAIVDLIFRRK